MGRYRKKPIVIDAFLWTGNVITVDPEWIVEAIKVGKVWFELGRYLQKPVNAMLIRTLEGVMEASVGDYIIRGIQGEIYPCKPDIFLASYEEVK